MRAFSWSLVLSVMLLHTAGQPASGEGDLDWIYSTGNWNNPTTDPYYPLWWDTVFGWRLQPPGDYQNPHVRNGGTVTISQTPAATCSALYVGGADAIGGTEGLFLPVGSESIVDFAWPSASAGLSCNYLFVGVQGGGSARFNHTGGIVSVWNKAWIAKGTDGSGIYDMKISTVANYLSPTDYLMVGSDGTGCFQQKFGTISITGGGEPPKAILGVGTSSASMTPAVTLEWLGAGAAGRYIQSGLGSGVAAGLPDGEPFGVYVGAGRRAYGEYYLLDRATLQVRDWNDTSTGNVAEYRGHEFGLRIGGGEASDPLDPAASGVGYFFLGDASQYSGTLKVDPLVSRGAAMTVRVWPEAQGTFRGWGTVQLGRTLTNNGRIIADGYGTDRTLDLSSFAQCVLDNYPTVRQPAVLNLIENTSDNGWFAQNHGELRLPQVSPITHDNNVCDWGESPLQALGTYGWTYYTYGATDPEVFDGIDLVNSVQLTFGSATSPAAEIRLVAPDRSDLPPMLDGWMPISIWKMKAAVTGTSTDVSRFVFRYDNTHLSSGGEPVLALLQYVPGATSWQEVSSGVALNTDKHQIVFAPTSAIALADSPHYFAVAAPGWRWVSPSEPDVNIWDWHGNWSAPMGSFPGDMLHPAWVTDGGTVLVDEWMNASAETLYLGCTPPAIPDQPASQIEMTGGTLTVNCLRMGAIDQQAKGKCTLSGGTVTVNGDLIAGETGTGTVSQTDAAVSVGQNLQIGLYPTSSGSYTLTSSGTLEAERISVGVEGSGTLILQSSAAPSITNVQSLVIRETLHAQGTLEGYGQIACQQVGTEPQAILTNNGKIIANGYGVEGRTLDLSGFHCILGDDSEHIDYGIQNSFENVPANGLFTVGMSEVDFATAHNGWYAIDKGKLKLPSVRLYPKLPTEDASVTANWGESYWMYGLAYPWAVGRDWNIDLVNSMQVTFPSVTAAAGQYAVMDISLLAIDCPEVSEGNAPPSPLVVGIWNVAFSNIVPPSGSATANTFRFRYDEQLVPADAEKELVVFWWPATGSWTQVPDCSVDIRTHIIKCVINDLSDGYFAVGLPDKKWVWNLQPPVSGNWTIDDHWDEFGLDSIAYPYPNCRSYSAYVDNGGTVVVDSGSSEAMPRAALYLHLGSNATPPPTTSGNLQIVGKAVSLWGLLIGEGTDSTGTCTLQGGQITDLNRVVVRAKLSATGTLQGWGTVSGSKAKLTNNGKVTADGYGDASHILTFSGFTMIGNTIPNTQTDTSGWYARQKGKLILPPVHVTAGNAGPYGWGDAPDDLDLVNGMMLSPSAVSANGDVSIALLANDRTESVITALTSVGDQPITVWEVGGGVPFGEADVMVRYDHTDPLVTQRFCGSCTDAVPERFLALAQWMQQADASWRWTIIGRAGDTADVHRIASGIPAVFSTSTTYLAVVQPLPGDTNLDGIVDIATDKAAVDAAWDKGLGEPGFDPAADFNGSGHVDVVDLLYIAGPCPPPQVLGLQMAQTPFATESMALAPAPEPAIGAATVTGPRASQDTFLSVGPLSQAMLAGAWVSDDGGEMLIIDDSGNVTSIWEAPDGPGYEIPCDGLPHVDIPEDQVAIDPHQFVLGQDGQVTVTPFVYTLIPEDTSIPPASETISGQGWLLDETHMTINVTCGTGEAASAVAVTYTKRAVAP